MALAAGEREDWPPNQSESSARAACAFSYVTVRIFARQNDAPSGHSRSSRQPIGLRCFELHRRGPSHLQDCLSKLGIFRPLLEYCQNRIDRSALEPSAGQETFSRNVKFSDSTVFRMRQRPHSPRLVILAVMRVPGCFQPRFDRRTHWIADLNDLDQTESVT